MPKKKRQSAQSDPRNRHDRDEATDASEHGGKHHKAHKKEKLHRLEALQIGLSHMQRRLISDKARLLVIIEGRDAAGKDGTIKRITEHMSPRDTRIVALGIPNEHEQRAWYFQRWCAQLPLAGEVVLFNRSWYNRAGVERVMDFCTHDEYEEFMATVPMFEQLLAHSGIMVLKYWLDISQKEQKRRIEDREKDPLKQWKISAMDRESLKRWDDYSRARDEMLARTHSVFAPWTVVRADDKPTAHLAVIRDLLARMNEEEAEDWELPDPTKVFLYDPIAHEKGWLEP